jgi:hypothetical protein
LKRKRECPKIDKQVAKVISLEIQIATESSFLLLKGRFIVSSEELPDFLSFLYKNEPSLENELYLRQPNGVERFMKSVDE